MNIRAYEIKLLTDYPHILQWTHKKRKKAKRRERKGGGGEKIIKKVQYAWNL